MLKVGRVAGTLMMLRCNWTSSSETCVPRPKQVWMDNSLPIGLDHRCVHCLLAWEMAKHEKQSARAGLKHWQPHLDDAGHPTLFQAELRKLLGNEQTDSIEQGITSLEEALYQAGRIGGKCNQTKCKFKGSDMLTHLPPTATTSNQPRCSENTFV